MRQPTRRLSFGRLAVASLVAAIVAAAGDVAVYSIARASGVSMVFPFQWGQPPAVLPIDRPKVKPTQRIGRRNASTSAGVVSEKTVNHHRAGRVPQHSLTTLALVALLEVTACSSIQSPANATHTESASSAPSPCVVSALEMGPDGMAPNGLAHAGPLWFSAFGTFVPASRAILPSGGGPPDGEKVVVVPDPASSGVVELSGRSCVGNETVRFCYFSCSWTTRRQAAVAVLSVDTSGFDLTGYMVFPGPGLMRLSVTKSRHAVGETVIQVPPD